MKPHRFGVSQRAAGPVLEVFAFLRPKVDYDRGKFAWAIEWVFSVYIIPSFITISPSQ
jgi:hypothetical protein